METEPMNKMAPDRDRRSVLRNRVIVGVCVLTLTTLVFANPFVRISLYSPFTGGAGPIATYRILTINEKVSQRRRLDTSDWEALLGATKDSNIGLRSMAGANLFVLYHGGTPARKDEIKQALIRLTADPEPSIRSMAYSQLIMHCHVPESQSLVARELQDKDEFVQKYAKRHEEYLAYLKNGTPMTSTVGGWKFRP